MYTIRSARIANEVGTAIVLTTDEVGDVAISELDTPEPWADYQKWLQEGGRPTQHTPIVREKPKDRIALLGEKLVAKGAITQPEWDEIAGKDDQASRISAEAGDAAIRG